MGNLIAFSTNNGECGLYVPLGIIEDIALFVKPNILTTLSKNDLKMVYISSIDNYMILKKNYDKKEYQKWYIKNRLLYNWPSIEKYNLEDYLGKNFVEMNCGEFYYTYNNSQKLYCMKLSNSNYFMMSFATFDMFLSVENKNKQKFLDEYISTQQIYDICLEDYNLKYLFVMYKAIETDFKYNIKESCT